MTNYYKILGVTENIDDVELKKRYTKLLKMYHPDNNVGQDTSEKVAKIIDAYNKIVEYRKTHSRNTSTTDSYNQYTDRKYSKHNTKNMHNKNKQMSKAAYDMLVNYISSYYDFIPKKSFGGKFNHSKIYVNETITENNLEFIDGYAQVVTGCESCADDFGCGLFGPTKELYYNYIDRNGQFLFKKSKSLVFTYIGRGLFINVYSDYDWYICCHKKPSQKLNISSYDCDGCLLIDIIIQELNRKYTMEANGMKYQPTPGVNIPMITSIVEQISMYDEKPRDMYCNRQSHQFIKSNQKYRRIV